MRRVCLAALLILPACEDHPASRVAVESDAAPTVERRFYSSWRHSELIDVLMVVDGGPAMAPWRNQVASQLGETAAVVASYTAPPTSALVNFGVLPASPAAGTSAPDGLLVATGSSGACLEGAPDRYLVSECGAGNFSSASSDGLKAAVTCMATLPSGGGAATPLAALMKALVEPRPAANSGFLREDAYLVLLMVSATDDGSEDSSGQPLSVDAVAKAMRTVKASAEMVTAIVMAPADSPRLEQFANALGGVRGVLGEDIAAKARPPYSALSPKLGLVCPPGIKDTDPAPGLQASCTVFYTRGAIDSSERTTSRIPACAEGAPPCWELVANTSCYPGPGEFRVRHDFVCKEAGMVDVRCAACAGPDEPGCEAAFR